MSHETIMFDVSFSQGQVSPRNVGCVVRIKPTGHQVFPDNFFEEQYKLMGGACTQHGEGSCGQDLLV